MAKYPWLEIENEFVTDTGKNPCSLKELADKYGVPYSRMRNYASKNGWTEKRNNHHANMLQKTSEKLADLMSDEATKAIARHFRISSNMLTVIEKALNNPDELSTNDSRILNLVNALDKLQRLQRQSLGVLDRKDEEQLAIAKKKIEPEETEGQEDDGFMQALGLLVKRVWDKDTNSYKKVIVDSLDATTDEVWGDEDGADDE